jgi:hypothetical protein
LFFGLNRLLLESLRLSFPLLGKHGKWIVFSFRSFWNGRCGSLLLLFLLYWLLSLWLFLNNFLLLLNFFHGKWLFLLFNDFFLHVLLLYHGLFCTDNFFNGLLFVVRSLFVASLTFGAIVALSGWLVFFSSFLVLLIASSALVAAASASAGSLRASATAATAAMSTVATLSTAATTTRLVLAFFAELASFFLTVLVALLGLGGVWPVFRLRSRLLLLLLLWLLLTLTALTSLGRELLLPIAIVLAGVGFKVELLLFGGAGSGFLFFTHLKFQTLGCIKETFFILT